MTGRDLSSQYKGSCVRYDFLTDIGVAILPIYIRFTFLTDTGSVS